MSLRDNKMMALRLLGLEFETIRLPELMHRLGEVLRKDLSEDGCTCWLRRDQLGKIGQKRGTKYIVGGQLEESKDEINSCLSSASLKVIEFVKRPLFERHPVAYADDWFDSYQPNSSYYLPEMLRTSGERANAKDPVGTYAHQIFNRLIIDLSYNSSRLEGNTYSLLDTEYLLFHGNTVEGKLDEEKAMILNHKEAIRFNNQLDT